jgi:hypothetical protein
MQFQDILVSIGAPESVTRAKAKREDALLGSFTPAEISDLEWTRHVQHYTKTKAFIVDITWSLDHYTISLITWQGDRCVKRFKANFISTALSRAKQLTNKY